MTTATENLKPEAHPQFPEFDTDLMSESCLGIGVQYPQLWQVVRRYILRGDTYFQAGGLATLSANVHSMPLDEAADVLEEYYKNHDYWPPMGQTARISLGGLKAIHAVGTIPIWLGGDAPIKRQIRMLGLLAKIEEKAGQVAAQDVPIVAEVRRAMQADRPFTAGDWLRRTSARAATEKEGTPRNAASGTEMNREEVVVLVHETVTKAMEDSTISQSDITAAKHGFEIAGEKIAALNQRINDLHVVISVGLGHEQTRASKGQVFWTKAGIVATIVTAILGTILATWALRQLGWVR
jgi:hypothetical protein